MSSNEKLGARSSGIATWINVVLDPEYQNLDCPTCHLRRIYLDKDIGYYCMACGRELSVDEIVLLIEKAQKTSQPIPTSEKSEVTPPMEIKEMPSPKAKEPERAIRDANERDTSEHT